MKIYAIDNQEEGGNAYFEKRKEAMAAAYETAANDAGLTCVYEYTTPHPSRATCVSMLNGRGWAKDSRIIAAFRGDFVRDEDGDSVYPFTYVEPVALTPLEIKQLTEERP